MQDAGDEQTGCDAGCCFDKTEGKAVNSHALDLLFPEKHSFQIWEFGGPLRAHRSLTTALQAMVPSKKKLYYLRLLIALAVCLNDSTAFGPPATIKRPTLPSARSQEPCANTLFSEPPRDSFNETIGINRGVYLLGFVLIANIWLFSVPPEFRRAKICTEEQVIQYPNSNCMTSTSWINGIGDYYKNGGGIEFDFSVEKSSQPAWMGGDQPFQGTR